MALFWFLIVVGLCWYPIYLSGSILYNFLIKKDTTNLDDNYTKLKEWLKKLHSLVVP